MLHVLRTKVEKWRVGFTYIACGEGSRLDSGSQIVSGFTESLSHQASIQGESDTEPDGLIQSITNKLGGIFSDDDSSEDADISDTDDNDDLFDPSLDKPVFLTPKGPMQAGRGKAIGVYRRMLMLMHACCLPL